MSRKHVVAIWSRTVVLGLLFLVLSLYILLASGFLGDVPGNIIGSIASDDSITIAFRGLRTDIFWNTSADSVIVTDPEGLVVAVTGIQIDGSLLDYLFSGHVDRILVDRLNINLAPDPDVEYDQSDSLISILNSIDTGIAASTDRLYLRYGIITESSATIIDSMYIDASIEREMSKIEDMPGDYTMTALIGLSRVLERFGKTADMLGEAICFGFVCVVLCSGWSRCCCSRSGV